jgi:hypothetical protein
MAEAFKDMLEEKKEEVDEVENKSTHLTMKQMKT